MRGQRVLTVRASESLHARLRAAAEERGVSLSTLIRSKLEQEDVGRLEERLDGIESQLHEIVRMLQAGIPTKVVEEPAAEDPGDWMQAMISPFLTDGDEGEGDVDE